MFLKNLIIFIKNIDNKQIESAKRHTDSYNLRDILSGHLAPVPLNDDYRSDI